MKSLRAKVFLGVLSGLLIVTLVAELLIYHQAVSFAEKELFDRLRKYAIALTEVVHIESNSSLTLYPDWENKLKISQEDRVQFFEFQTLNGDFLIDSHNLGGDSLPDVGQHQGKKLENYGNIVLGIYQHHFSLALQDQSEISFKLLVAENTDLIRRARDTTLQRLLLFTPVALVAAFIISFGLTSITLSSITRFKNRVQSYNRNDNRSRLNLNSIDKELIPLGEAINKYIGQLNQHAILESKLLADTAHELRTPLVNIRNELDQLGKSDSDNPALTASVKTLDKDVLTLQRMTDNMLMLYRIESGNYHPRLEKFDLESEIVRIIQALPASERALIEYSGKPQEIYTNRSVLSLILNQLMNNALQYATGAKINVSWLKNGNTILLHVDDAGPGIPETERERIFERHYRFENQNQSRTGGSGLGLALVRLYARAVNAVTQCEESAVGGARFSVVFPDSGSQKKAGLST